MNAIDGVIGLSQNVAGTYTDLAAIVRFNNTGSIDAMSGTAYQAANVIPYSSLTYHFRMDVDVLNHVYSAYVKAPGGSMQTIGQSLSFRNTQASALSLSYLNLNASTGSQTLCNVSVSPLAGPTPTPMPTPTPIPTGTESPGPVFSGKAWYVDNAVASSGNGQSWATAWNSFSNIQWSSVKPGDGVFISGGSTSKTYTATSNGLLTISASGTASAPIFIRPGQDAGHNGVVILDGNGHSDI
jgi:hypothetical protein